MRSRLKKTCFRVLMVMSSGFVGMPVILVCMAERSVGLLNLLRNMESLKVRLGLASSTVHAPLSW